MLRRREADPLNTDDLLDWIRRQQAPPTQGGVSRTLSVVDLFCGCGGMTLGAWEAARLNGRRLDVRLAVDIRPEPVSVYRENLCTDSNRARVDDVARLLPGNRGEKRSSTERYWKQQVGSVDLIVAGPPCQGHSDLNNSTRREDPRNALYLRVARAAEVFRPKAIIIENVPTVVHDRSEVVPQTRSWLSDLGYMVSDRAMNLVEFGVPQLRKRHILLAARSRGVDLNDFHLSGRPFPTLGQFISGLEDEPIKRTEIFYRPAKISAANVTRVEYLFSKQIYDLPNSQRPACHRDKKHAYVSMYGRMHWDRPAQTLTSGFGSMGQGRYVHPTRKRLLTPHEAARIQGFPDFFSFKSVRYISNLREMIANAVPPQFTATLVEHLIRQEIL